MSDATWCPKGKRGYVTREDAERALKALLRMRRRVRGLTADRIYHCPWCDQYHLTHKPARTEADA